MKPFDRHIRKINLEPRENQVSRPWETRYKRKLLFSDVVAVLLSIFGAQLLRFGLEEQEVNIAPFVQGESSIQYTMVSIGLAFLWLLSMDIGQTRDPKVIGIGLTEYKRVVNSTVFTFGLFAIIAFATRAQIGRGYVLIALPTGIALLLVSRWIWRKRLHHQRGRDLNTYRTLIVAERLKTVHLAREISRVKYAGFELIGAVTEHGTNSDLLPGLPVVANYDDILTAVDQYKVDTVIVTSVDSITPERMRVLGWGLGARGVDLIVAAALTDVAGPRIHLRPVSGLPLIHVEHPEFSGRKLFLKRLFDILVSALLLLILSPLFLLIAVLVRGTSKGSVFYLQTRVGWYGKEFQMVKFRSMVADAEAGVGWVCRAV